MDDYRFPSPTASKTAPDGVSGAPGQCRPSCVQGCSPDPKIHTDACVGCGICKTPAGKTISMDGPSGRPASTPGLHPHCYYLPRTLPPEGRGPPGKTGWAVI